MANHTTKNYTVEIETRDPRGEWTTTRSKHRAFGPRGAANEAIRAHYGSLAFWQGGQIWRPVRGSADSNAACTYHTRIYVTDSSGDVQRLTS